MNGTTAADAAVGPLLRFQRVASPARGALAALPALSFTLGAGARAWLVGSPASGKSRALDLIAAAAPPPTGRMALFGAWADEIPRAERPAIRRRIGLVFQDLRLASELSVLGNVALAARAAGRHRDDYLPQARQLLRWVGLGRRGDDGEADLDLDGRWRLALARALVNGPELLILDDLGAGLGIDRRQAIFRLVDESHAAGIAVLMTSDEATAVAHPDMSVIRLSRAGPAPAMAEPA